MIKKGLRGFFTNVTLTKAPFIGKIFGFSEGNTKIRYKGKLTLDMVTDWLGTEVYLIKSG